MQPPPEQPVAPIYRDSVHMGDVVGQQVLQQNVHHHSTEYQQFLQPCMGCGNRNYLKPAPCSTRDCKIVGCDQCMQMHGRFPYCENHIKIYEFLDKFSNIIILFLPAAFLFAILMNLL